MKKTVSKEENKITETYYLDNYSHDDINENDPAEKWRLMLGSDYNYHLGMSDEEYYESECYEVSR